MNIHQDDVSGPSQGTWNNNIDAGTCTCKRTGKAPTGCVSCKDQLVSSQQADVSELKITASTKTGLSLDVDKGNLGQVQSESRDLLQYNLGDSDQVEGVSGLDSSCEGLKSSGVTKCPDGDQGLSEGGQQDQSEENNPGQTAGVCPELGPDSQSTKGESDIEEDTMRNCSCEESGLCYCTSSAFNQPGNQVVWQTPRKSPQSGHSKRSGRNMDAVIVTDEEIGSEKTEERSKVVSLEEGEDVKQCKSFMEDLVHRIFNDSASICQEDNAKFGEYCRLAIGRQWFARLVDSQRVNSKKVTEQTFYRLVQFFAVCLFECSDADDFTPGKSLMNMCFTFYHEHEGFPRCDDTTRKSFLYSHLTEQPIWKSLRFWNAAFFDAVHQERKQRQPDHQVNWRHLSTEERENTETLNENITFGQLATFLHNMMELELSREICQEFLDKMATIGNLSPDQKELIQSNISNHFHTEMQENTKNKKHPRPFRKMSFMKRKVGREAVA